MDDAEKTNELSFMYRTPAAHLAKVVLRLKPNGVVSLSIDSVPEERQPHLMGFWSMDISRPDHRAAPFRAVAWVDREGTVHWEPGRQPTSECLLYVAGKP